ncbi:hypothetical protein HBI56_139210 [Parastagonospora nodorum]|uniref:Uncharacterized protein n=1 Tax=Phaeosphaeria nodorum (strain SN15 / ATCC MYA-4574 / FGSC 10173) TaxID=321614 RepID=A0A7U2NPF1_PHANO|nr:hypothetical protein HBH56_128590 [Parastagonospora nodorum]QRD05655.1 hypothetical protein JI435_304220 [Parastagonospora nodorum SN15]KAH3931190.1 hypothetical protein HBH54_094890 [Parastagonospora nodorum]KAH3947369.1 hypothetical protein HBH53_118890 [Parastagonospora nodorum]KAH3970628.1 hypothetical protein HBH51_115300 [Parastagonospora nodorum]
MGFWSNLRTKHQAKQHVRKLVTAALSTEECPIPHWDDVSRIVSDTHALLSKVANQLPLAKDRILQGYSTIINRGPAHTACEEEEQFEQRFVMLQNVTMKIQSLRADIMVLEREVVRARREGEGPDDGARQEFGN